MLAVINYYEHCNLVDLEEVPSVVHAKTALLLAGYQPLDSHPYAWRKSDAETALIVPVSSEYI